MTKTDRKLRSRLNLFNMQRIISLYRSGYVFYNGFKTLHVINFLEVKIINFSIQIIFDQLPTATCIV